MKDYSKEFEKLKINTNNLPKNENPEKFANTFKKCSIQKHINTYNSNISKTTSTNK